MKKFNTLSLLLSLFTLSALVFTGCLDQSNDDGDDDPQTGDPVTVEVVFGDVREDVDLSKATLEDVEGENYVTLTSVLQLALPNENLENLTYDFVAGDGFQPLDSTNCEGLIPLTGDLLVNGYIHPTSRNLIWDATLEYPGCLHIKDLAQILVTASDATAKVKIAYDGNEIEVDLGNAEQEDIDGESYAKLASVVALAITDRDVTELVYDFEASDGFKASDSPNCSGMMPLEGSNLSKGFIHSQDADLTWDETADLPGCLSVKDLAIIHASEPPEPTDDVLVKVMYGETAEDVKINTLDTTAVGEENLVPLESIVKATLPDATLADLMFNFHAADGFSPLDSSNCSSSVPLAGNLLTYGYVNPESRNLTWADDANLPGCMKVNDLATIAVYDMPENTQVSVEFKGESYPVDLLQAAKTTIGDELYCNLSSIVSLALPNETPEDLRYDFIAGDDFMPLDGGSNCDESVPVTGSLLQYGYIRLSDRKLYWDDTANLPGCLKIKDVDRILAYGSDDSPSVTVEFDGDSTDVMLNKVELETIDNAEYAKLDAIISVALPNETIADLQAEFVSNDGYTPADSDNCTALVPLAGNRFADGRVHVNIRKLIWIDGSDMPGCLQVRNLSKIKITSVQ